jgi:hypothetical protein
MLHKQLLYCSHFCLLKTIVILPCFFVFAMKCKMCQQVANFRARNEGEPFEWWCKWCYDVHEHQQIPDDIEHQTLCIHCKDQPASCRIKSPLKACWEYWCYTCFERFDHKEDFDDFAIVDLDAPSDEYSDESEDPHDHEGEVDTQSCGSFNSWCMPNAGNLKALDIMETQSNADDAVSVASGSSWALTYQVVDNDDTASVSSFQMLPSVQAVDNDDTASVSSFQMVSACNEQQQEQEQQHDPEHHQELQQQQDAHEHQKQQQLQHQHHHQPDEEPDGKHDEELDREMPSLGAWQEDEQLVIALQMSLRDIAEQAEPIADSSSIISSSSSSSSSTAAATANVDDPFGQFIPEYGSAASSSSAASAPQTLMLPRIRNQRKGPKQASKVPERYVAMAKIDEIVGSHDQIHASEYIDLSGCTDTIFTDKPTTTSIQPHRLLCPIHQLEHNIYCQACNNYQFMKEKQQCSMAMQHSIQDSYDTSSIIFIDQLPYCSSHDQDMKEWCGTCSKAVALRDQMAQMA